MLLRFSRIVITFFVLAYTVLVLSGEAHAYAVSGLAEFSYRSYETKVGASKSSYQTWDQNYMANLAGHLIDPRILLFNAGVGFSDSHSSSGTDAQSLNYNLRASFFPGMYVSWDLYGSKTTTSIASPSSLDNYDVTSTSYGGALRLNLASGRGKRNNNNWANNNNNSNKFGGNDLRFLLPDITLSHDHTESESDRLPVPLRETRDTTKASLQYFTRAAFKLQLDGSIETYENLLSGAGYKSTTLTLDSYIRPSSGSELTISGRTTEREVDSIAGFSPTEKTQTMNVRYDVRGKNGVEQYYRYDFNKLERTNGYFTTQRGDAQIRYTIVPELKVFGGVEYGAAAYHSRDAAGAVTEYTTDSGGLVAGASFGKTYRPDFLGPFSFHTNYDFRYGFIDVSSATAGTSGSGNYYTNNFGAGIASVDWKEENLSLDYSFNNKRDHSPNNNNSYQHTTRFAVSSRRIPRTTLRATASYYVQESESAIPNVFSGAATDTMQQHRAYFYDATADYAASSYLNFGAGASRGHNVNNTYTLSTLTPVSINGQVTIEDVAFGTARFVYPFTRDLLYRADAREEYRSENVQDVVTRSHQLTTGIDYRIRKIYVNIEYRLRQDIPDNAQRVTQQTFLAKLSRPF